MQGRGQGRGRGQCHPDAGEGLIVGVQAVACMLSFVRLIEM